MISLKYRYCNYWKIWHSLTFTLEIDSADMFLPPLLGCTSQTFFVRSCLIFLLPFTSGELFPIHNLKIRNPIVWGGVWVPIVVMQIFDLRISPNFCQLPTMLRLTLRLTVTLFFNLLLINLFFILLTSNAR